MLSDREELAYLAGFFDGEGSISLEGGKAVRLGVGQIVKTPLLKFEKRFGGIVRDRVFRGGISRRPMFYWDVGGLKAVEALEAMLPYLWVKRDEAIVAIGFFTCQNPRTNRLSEAQKGLRRTQLALISYLKRRSYQLLDSSQQHAILPV